VNLGSPRSSELRFTKEMRSLRKRRTKPSQSLLGIPFCAGHRLSPREAGMRHENLSGRSLGHRTLKVLYLVVKLHPIMFRLFED
jgi:hypothetical protein